MRNWHKVVFIFIFTVTCSCNTISELSQKKFVYKSKHRKLELKFVNDSICTLTNTFCCPNIEPEYKVIIQRCMYFRDSCKIYITNLEPKNDNDIHREIRPQNCRVCGFLSESKREIPFRIGPRYATDYEKYGMVPNIITDTLHIVCNKIFYYKEKNRESIGFIFKRK